MFELKIDGIFGLGPPRSDDLCGFESPLYTAYKNKLINKSIFSVYMHNSKDSGNGEYGGGEKGLISLVVKSPNTPQLYTSIQGNRNFDHRRSGHRDFSELWSR